MGPVLFLILIGDIDENISKPSFTSSFADDTRVGRPVRSKEDTEELQKDLDEIYNWATTNNMMFNSSKFECLRYGSDSGLKEATTYITENGDEIGEKSATRDLGVTMSNNGYFKEHIEKVRQSVNKLCSWILRTFQTRNRPTMLTLWKSLVIPHLDYCSQIWSPSRQGDIQILEMIQKSFIYKITGYHHLDYWEKLREFDLYSLERRRDRYGIIYVWKIIEGLVPNIGISHYNAGRRGRLCAIPHIRSNSPTWIRNLCEASFSHRGPLLFNVLPKEIREITSCGVSKFKANLDRWLRIIPDEPLIHGYTARRRTQSNSVRHMVTCVSEEEARLHSLRSNPSTPDLEAGTNDHLVIY